jgi:hypothetical protein
MLRRDLLTSYISCWSTEHTVLKMTILLAGIDFPVAVALKAQLKETILGIVTFAALGTR